MPKIVLSSVHGSAAGAGMGLAFVADLCIAADDARFTPAYAKIGVSPDGGSTVGMVGTVGVRRALQIFLGGGQFSAQQAYDWGLVASIVPAAELKAATRKFAERLAQNPPAAIAGTKSLVYQAAVTPTKQQLDAEEEKIIDAMHTDEFPRRGEEIHQQVEMKRVWPRRRALFLCLRHGVTELEPRRACFRAARIIALNDEGILQAHAAALRACRTRSAATMSSPARSFAASEDGRNRRRGILPTPLAIDGRIPNGFRQPRGTFRAEVMKEHGSHRAWSGSQPSCHRTARTGPGTPSRRSLRCIGQWLDRHPQTLILFVCHDAV